MRPLDFLRFTRGLLPFTSVYAPFSFKSTLCPMRHLVARPGRVFSTKNSYTSPMYLWIDVDSYECQVWSRLHPEFQNGPFIVANGPAIVSCNHEAKTYGINRTDSIESAKTKCPSLKVFKNRNTSDETEDVIRVRDNLEISVENVMRDDYNNRIKYFWDNDEGCFDIANEVDLQIANGLKNFQPNTWQTNVKWILGNDEHPGEYDDEDLKRLKVGVNNLAEILRRIECDTGLYASGSVGTTICIAKLACHLNKPRGITVVTDNGFDQFLSLVKIVDAPGLKGTNGREVLDKWKKPDGSSLETLQDFKQHVPLDEFIEAGYLKTYLYSLVSHWEDMDGSGTVTDYPIDFSGTFRRWIKPKKFRKKKL